MIEEEIEHATIAPPSLKHGVVLTFSVWSQLLTKIGWLGIQLVYEVEGTGCICMSKHICRIFICTVCIFLWFLQDVTDPAKGFVKDDSIILVSYIKVKKWVNGDNTWIIILLWLAECYRKDIPADEPGAASVPNLSSVLSCPICSEEFEATGKMQPMSLICGHSFCTGEFIHDSSFHWVTWMMALYVYRVFTEEVYSMWGWDHEDLLLPLQQGE